MTAVIYARYSSDNQREESIEGQIRECTAYAEKNDITIVKHYIDRAISAKTDNRPQFQQMIKDSDKKLFDIVLVWKLDRFARNRYDSARYKTQLKKNGVKLVSATEIISEGPEGIILESVLEGYAEYYSADLSEKVIRGMTENALKGKFTGGAIPFGYTINADRRFEIDPLTAPFVAETFQRYNDGQTMREIRDWLNEKGIKNKRGGPMSFNTIQHMASSHILQIFLRVTVQNQIGIAQRVIVDEVIQLRPLRHGHVQRILDLGAVDRNLSVIPEQQFHAAGVHVEFAGSFIVLHVCVLSALRHLYSCDFRYTILLIRFRTHSRQGRTRIFISEENEKSEPFSYREKVRIFIVWCG